MFTKKVTDDDNFMQLSSSAQALYLHLSMSADDDGFCNQVSLCMFKAHASVQDLQALLEKRYIYQFDNGVIVIKHWRINNDLRNDRYTETKYAEEKAELNVDDKGIYHRGIPDGIPPGIPSIDKDSIDKISLDQDRLGKGYGGNPSSTPDTKWTPEYMESIRERARKAYHGE